MRRIGIYLILSCLLLSPAFAAKKNNQQVTTDNSNVSENVSVSANIEISTANTQVQNLLNAVFSNLSQATIYKVGFREDVYDLDNPSARQTISQGKIWKKDNLEKTKRHGRYQTLEIIRDGQKYQFNPGTKELVLTDDIVTPKADATYLISNYQFELEDKDKNYLLVGNKTTEDDNLPDKIRLTITKDNNLLIKKVSIWNDKGTRKETFKYIQKKGLWLVKRHRIEQDGKGYQRVYFGYQLKKKMNDKVFSLKKGEQAND